jgi:AraC family transcriptional regulator
VPEHAHEWPLLSLFVIGSYWNETEIGKTFVSGPSAVFYAAGAAHRNAVAAVGFEQIEIEFDPDWLGRWLLPQVPVRQWIGGRAGREARCLAHACTEGPTEDRLRSALRRFVESAGRLPERTPVPWIDRITRRLREDTTLRITDLAMEARRHPSWVGSAYRQAIGERPQETVARYRVEHAARLLRETDQSPTSIALEAGFCDQSHMIRNVRRVLGRSPTDVREDRRYFRQPPASPRRRVE